MVTAKTVNDNIEALSAYFEQYSNNEYVKKLKDIKDKLNEQEYKIAVVANMSTGKSTFINALFGADVLPAFNYATTDCAIFIESEPDIEKKAVITFEFEDGKSKITIQENLEKEIKQYAQKDEECKDEKYKNVDKINLYYPFKHIQNAHDSQNKDFKVIFIDTPGPNSTGGEYKDKHKNQTRTVLNDVDMALFMFDYGQLDANLESDEQGLWNTIRERKNKDKNFEVFFIINKIDMAIDDNVRGITTKDREKYKKEYKEKWNTHEKKAIEKIKEAANKHGINDAQIYTVSSHYELLKRIECLNYDDEDKLESFQKKFKRIFEQWEEEFIQYLGFEKLEGDINGYIDTEVKQRIIKARHAEVMEIYNEEDRHLSIAQHTLEQPKQEAQERLNQAKKFLEHTAQELEAQYREKNNDIKEHAVKEIEQTLEQAIQKYFYDEIEDIAKKAFCFMQFVAQGNDEHNAKRIMNKFETDEKDKYVKQAHIVAKSTKHANRALEKTPEYINSLINDCANNFLDTKIDIKNSYAEMNREYRDTFEKFKKEIHKQIEKDLDIEIEEVAFECNIDDLLSFKVDIPSSTFAYNFEEAKYEKEGGFMGFLKGIFPFFFGERKLIKTKDEKHTFDINPKELREIIEKNLQENINKFRDDELSNHKHNIAKLDSENKGLFSDLRNAQLNQIAELQRSIKDSEKKLAHIRDQRAVLKNSIRS